MNERKDAEAILDDIEEAVDQPGPTEVGALQDSLGHRGTGTFLLVPALIGVSPVGGIPTVPTIVALIILVFAVQVAMGRTTFWLPDMVRRRRLDGGKLSKFAEKLRGAAEWLDTHTGERLKLLTGGPATRIAGAIAALLCLAVPPLELLPFAAALPFAAIAMIGLGLIVRDGAVMLLAFATTAAVVAGAAIIWAGG